MKVDYYNLFFASANKTDVLIGVLFPHLYLFECICDSFLNDFLPLLPEFTNMLDPPREHVHTLDCGR